MPKLSSLNFFAIAVFLVAYGSTLSAAESSAPIEFNRDIRPILSDKCFACHGLDAKHREAELRLDTLEGAIADHDGHRALVPRDLNKSELWQRIITTDAEKRMPPADSNKSLTASEKDLIRRWIEQGAPYQKHWAFEAPAKVEVPKLESSKAGQTSNPLDAFLLDRLQREKLALNPEASRETLVRRVAFSLTGLPPTPAEVDDYVNDRSPDAYERMVDRYLASPRFGEEMARYWLDLARYADTHGLHLDNERQMWAYRDWVVGAFNRNQPFDKFTIEQIAGDMLPNATKEQQTATGFNRCNVTTSEGGSINDELLYRYAVDRTSTTMEVWLGLTGGCAVCHDHKFDPISHREFYSMYAFFNSAADPGADGNLLLTKPVLKLATTEQDKKLAELQARITSAQKQIDEAIAKVKYVDPATIEPKPPIEEKETIWLDDDFPAGAKLQSQPPTVPAQWITSTKAGDVVSGKRALRRTEGGLAQDFYAGGAVPFDVPPGAEFFLHVLIDPQDPPKAVMLQLHNSGWNQRAVWGNVDAIALGAKGTRQRVHMGPLPPAGEWTRLVVSAEKLGLKPGDDITGFSLTLKDGTVTWDKVGMTGRTDPGADPERSLLAWRKGAAGKDTQGVSVDVNKVLKAGLAKKLTPAEEKLLQDYYIQQVCVDTKESLKKPTAELADAKAKFDALDKTIPSTFIYNDLPTPRDSFVMIRGQYNQPGEKVEPAVLAVLPPLKKADPKARATRLDLARWLVAPENPLTARVTVNRFWQQFFGTGLVRSSADFGSQGEPPSHPELLDWLALRFMHGSNPPAAKEQAAKDSAGPWDVKGLIRLMLTSAAFKQTARVTPALVERDPENRLLARGPRFRLDAEQLRDNVLFVSGLMDHTMGGKGVNPYQPPNVWEPVGFVGSNTRNYKQDTGSALYRRSLYTFLKRTAPPPFMVNFDGPNREQFCSRRERSNTPLQALQLMNDVQHIEAARALGERMLKEGGKTPEERIQFAFRVVLSRKPEADEMKIVLEELAAHRAKFAKDEASAKLAIAHGESKPDAKLAPVELAAYTLTAGMLLNLDETLNRN
ncbi:MAG: PSD1 and planctomycete cytochrome C domain-containing protein [Planctomycetia bacterium]|nr:PSD1 and planctomycete cytochrome C domain-containing protein [Planctomycetia bacterium]